MAQKRGLHCRSWKRSRVPQVQNLPSMQETRVQSLGQKDPLEEELATHSSILAWEISWTEEPGGLPPRGCKESNLTKRLSLSLFHFHPGKGRDGEGRGQLEELRA